MLKHKQHIEKRMAHAEKHLAGRLAALASAGIVADRIQRDATARHFRAKIRQARRQLTDIAALEQSIARQEQIKAEKLAAPKSTLVRKKHASNPLKKREKRERKEAAAATKEAANS